MPIGHEAGVTSSARACAISSSRSNGSRASRSSLLTKAMIGTSRNRHTSKSLRVCSSMSPWRHWGPRSVRQVYSLKSEWAEILVARRVEQVEGEPLVLEAHHRRGNRDAALALDRHPDGAHPPPLTPRPHFARQLDRPAKQQQLLGQGWPASGCLPARRGALVGKKSR